MRRLAWAALAFLPACSSLLGIQSVVEDTTQSPDSGPPACGVAPSFGLLSAADGVAGSSLMVEDDGSLFFGLLLNVNVKRDLFALWLRPGRGALASGLVPGHYTLTGAETSLATCGVCAFIATDFDSTTFTARDFYFATGGTLDLTSAGPQLVADLKNLTFQHIDLATGAPIDTCTSAIQEVLTNVSVPGGNPDAGVPDAPPPPDATVTPSDAGGPSPDAGNVTTGTAIDTYVTEQGETTRPVDLSGTTIQVLVPNGPGYDIYPGSGKSDGTFSVPNAPPGPRYVHVGATYLATAADSQLDFGSNYLGRGNYNETVDQDKFSVDLTNGEIAKDGDFFEVFSASINGAFSFAADVGSMELSTDIWFSRAIEGDKGDRVVVTELAGRKSALLEPYSTLTRYVQLPTFSTVSGETVPIPPAAFGSIAQSNTATVNWLRSQFQQAGKLVNPSATYVDDQLYVFVMPGGGKLDLGLSAAPDLFFVGRSVLGDTNLGMVSYGNPFGSPYQKLTWSSTRFTVPYTAPGATNALQIYGYLSRTDPVSVLAAPLGIAITPVVNPRINGLDAFVGHVGVGAMPMLSWSPPAMGTPTGAIVTIDELTNEVGDTAASYVAFIYTANNQLRLPPNVLQTGHTYFARITAFVAPNTFLVHAPYRRGTPNAYSDVLTAPFSP